MNSIEAAGATRIGDLGQPDWLQVAGGSTWAAGVGDGVGRLDGKTGKSLGSVAVPGVVCLGMDVGFESLWVPSCGVPTLTRIDPKSGRILASIPLAVEDLREESSIGAGEGGVWVLSGGGDPKLLKIDPKTNALATTFAQPPGSAALRAAYGALWITNSAAGTLMKVDPATGAVSKEIPVGAIPRFLAVGEDAVWVMNQQDATVSRIDPKTAAVVATISVGSTPIEGGDIAVGGGSVWVRVSDSLIARIDPKTNRVVGRYGPPAGSGSVAADASAVWVSAHDVSSVWRLPLP